MQSVRIGIGNRNALSDVRRMDHHGFPAAVVADKHSHMAAAAPGAVTDNIAGSGIGQIPDYLRPGTGYGIAVVRQMYAKVQINLLQKAGTVSTGRKTCTAGDLR